MCALKWPSDAICEGLRGTPCECHGLGGCQAGWMGKATVQECEKWMRVHSQAMLAESTTGMGNYGCAVDLVILTHVFNTTVEIAGVRGLEATEDHARLGQVGQRGEASAHNVRLQYEHGKHYNLLHEHEGAEAQDISSEEALEAFRVTRREAHTVRQAARVQKPAIG